MKLGKEIYEIDWDAGTARRLEELETIRPDERFAYEGRIKDLTREVENWERLMETGEPFKRQHVDSDSLIAHIQRSNAGLQSIDNFERYQEVREYRIVRLR